MVVSRLSLGGHRVPLGGGAKHQVGTFTYMSLSLSSQHPVRVAMGLLTLSLSPQMHTMWTC